LQTEDHDLLLKMGSKVDEIHRELITGNGGPSIKERVSSLEETRAGVKGWVAGASAAVTSLWGFLEWMFHHTGGGHVK